MAGYMELFSWGSDTTPVPSQLTCTLCLGRAGKAYLAGKVEPNKCSHQSVRRWRQHGPPMPPYPVFKAALEAGDLDRTLTLARAMPTVGLVDAAAILHLMAVHADDRFDRAAMRWVQRFCAEAKTATLEDVSKAVRLLDLLGEEPGAVQQIAAFCKARNVA
jgi:hypothetical protein